MIPHSLHQTLSGKFIVLLLCILVLQATQLAVGIDAVLHLGEESGLVNAAGKQRMRTFLLASYARQAVDVGAWEASHRGIFDQAIADTDAFFLRYSPVASNPEMNYTSEAHFVAAKSAWEGELRPLLVTIGQGKKLALAMGALQRYESLAPDQVRRYDDIVTLVEADIRTDTLYLAIFQSLLLGASLMLGILGLYMARTSVTLPMRRLIEAAGAIAAGAYQQRVPVVSRDEIGQLARTFNQMTAAVAEKTERITALNQVAVVITSSLSKEDAFDRIMRHGMRLVRAQGACIALYDQTAGHFDERVTQGLSETFVSHQEFVPGDLADKCFSSNTYIVSHDSSATEYPLSQRERDEGIRCFICLPLTSQAKHLGVISFYLTDRDTFLPDEIEILITFVHLAAGAIENARLYAAASEEAAHDMLTGLYNRRIFEQRLTEEAQRAVRFGKPYSLLMLDIDHFKAINDTLGHPAGDLVLKSLAQFLKREARDIDTVARYGGEEFVVILPETEGMDAALMAERLRIQIAARPILLPMGGGRSITVSIGVASYPQCANTPQRVVERADQALYVAKRAGRNRVSFYGEMLKTQLENNPGKLVELLDQDLQNITAVAAAVDAKSAFFHNHADTADEYSAQLGRLLGLDPVDLERLHYAALLHDVGLITVPDDVLGKSVALSTLETDMIRRHPVIMADILEQTQALKLVAPVVRHHHEHFDGSGYPHGLKGDAIPYLARILAVVDAYSALVGSRPHRRAMAPREACNVLVAEAGKQFDPDIVRAFSQLIENQLPRPK